MIRTKALLICVIILLALTGCSNAEQGQIEDVKIEDQETVVDAYSEENIFTPVKNPFSNYKYKSEKIERAHMEIVYPSSWDCKIKNARHIEINSPDSDSLFGPLTMHVFYDYGFAQDVNENISDYGTLFKDDLIGAKYNIDGNTYNEVSYVFPSEQLTEDSFTEHTDKISLEIRDDVLVNNHTGYMPEEECTALYYSVYWDKTPCVISTICKSSDIENVRKLLTFLVSSIRYVPDGTDTFTEYSYSGTGIALPKEFVQNTENKNVFDVPASSTSKYAGMHIGIFESDNEIDQMTFPYEYAESITKTFEPRFASKFENAISPNPYTEEFKIDGKDVTAFKNVCTINPRSHKSGDFYMPAQTWYLDNIIIPNGSGNKIISIWFQDSQFDLEHELVKTICPKITL